MENDPPGLLDLDQFADLNDALEQIADSRVYERELNVGLGDTFDLTLVSMFAMSACTRFRALHEGIAREIRASNPHTVLPLMRAFAETVLTVAYITDHPEYVERIIRSRGEQPKDLKRLPIKALIEHIAPEAPGFAAVYDDLCEITHFGSKAMWQPHGSNGDLKTEWASPPRWKQDGDALIACAQLKELSMAGEVYLHNLVERIAATPTSEDTA